MFIFISFFKFVDLLFSETIYGWFVKTFETVVAILLTLVFFYYPLKYFIYLSNKQQGLVIPVHTRNEFVTPPIYM